MTTRHLQLEGARNLRDIGGYRTTDGRVTRWNMVYRSDCLDRLGTQGQAWLVNNGLKTAIDLRSFNELKTRPSVFSNGAHVTTRHVPIFDDDLPDNVDPPPLDVGYRRMLFERTERVRRVFEVLLEPDVVPAAIFCAAGKDRTGITIALLLGALGVPNETIIEDWALSATCLGEPYKLEGRQWAEGKGWVWERVASQFDCEPALMQELLEELDRDFGGASGYLERCAGLQAAQLEQLRLQLLQ